LEHRGVALLGGVTVVLAQQRSGVPSDEGVELVTPFSRRFQQTGVDQLVDDRRRLFDLPELLQHLRVETGRFGAEGEKLREKFPVIGPPDPFQTPVQQKRDDRRGAPAPGHVGRRFLSQYRLGPGQQRRQRLPGIPSPPDIVAQHLPGHLHPQRQAIENFHQSAALGLVIGHRPSRQLP
jgi:hypothetical protein